MVSSSPATTYAWDLTALTDRDIVRVDVTDCDASAGVEVRAFNSIVEGQNNTNWVNVHAELISLTVDAESNIIIPPMVRSVSVIIDETVAPVYDTDAPDRGAAMRGSRGDMERGFFRSKRGY
jgi:hypothetical protein